METWTRHDQCDVCNVTLAHHGLAIITNTSRRGVERANEPNHELDKRVRHAQTQVNTMICCRSRRTRAAYIILNIIFQSVLNEPKSTAIIFYSKETCKEIFESKHKVSLLADTTGITSRHTLIIPYTGCLTKDLSFTARCTPS